MNPMSYRLRFRWLGALLAGAMAVAVPARAEWTRVTDIPVTQIFSVREHGDTLTAGADTAVYVSTNAGVSWLRSAKPIAGVTSIQATWVRNGRLYAGTFGQGVHVSDDLGATWHPFNDGLVGGILNSQLFVVDLQGRGDSLFAATAGAGVYVRSFAPAGTWHLFGAALEPNQASNVNSLALGGTRLMVSAGSNGQMFFSEPGDADWTISDLGNVGLLPGVAATTSVWSGTGWLVGTNRFLFRSVAGQEPWTISDPGLGSLAWTTFAAQGHHLFGAFVTGSPLAAVMQESDDDGATWQNREVFPGVFVFRMVVHGGAVYAARSDGLWRRAAGTTSVPGDGVVAHRLRFGLAGPQPFANVARLRFELPEPQRASIELFDVSGREAGLRIDGSWSAGPHEVELDARNLTPGVYMAVLSAGALRDVVRLVSIR